MPHAFEGGHKPLTQKQRLAIHGCKPLEAMAGLEAIEWHPFWKELGMEGMPWQQRVREMLGVVGKCTCRAPRRGVASPCTWLGVMTSNASSATCLLLDKQVAEAIPAPLTVHAHSRPRRGSYVSITLGWQKQQVSRRVCSRRVVIKSVGSRPVPVRLLLHQLLALAEHGLPESTKCRHALHLPHKCPTQNGLCCCMGHVGWGSAWDNRAHMRLTQAARVRVFRKLPLEGVQQHLDGMPHAARRAACGSVAAVAALLDEVGPQVLDTMGAVLARRRGQGSSSSSSSSSSSKGKGEGSSGSGGGGGGSGSVHERPGPMQLALPAKASVPSRLRQQQQAAEKRQQAFVQQHGQEAWEERQQRRQQRAASALSKKAERGLRQQHDWSSSSSSSRPSSSSSSVQGAKEPSSSSISSSSSVPGGRRRCASV